MKKLLAMLLVLAMISCLFVACANNDSETDAPTTAPTDESKTNESTDNSDAVSYTHLLLRLGTPAEVRPRWNMLLLAGLLPDAPEAFSSARRLEMTNHEIQGCPQENGAS